MLIKSLVKNRITELRGASWNMGALHPTFNQGSEFKSQPQSYLPLYNQFPCDSHTTAYQAGCGEHRQCCNTRAWICQETLASSQEDRVVTSYSHRSFKWLEVQGLEYGQAPFTKHTVTYISWKIFYWPFG